MISISVLHAEKIVAARALSKMALRLLNDKMKAELNRGPSAEQSLLLEAIQLLELSLEKLPTEAALCRSIVQKAAQRQVA